MLFSSGRKYRLNSEGSGTLQNILDAGKAEFLEKGFRAASLRSIARAAGVTTGAFYGYFRNKEELFDALVKEEADYFTEEFRKVTCDFQELPPEGQKAAMGQVSGEWMLGILDYIYDHFDAFRLLLSCAEGTKYEHFIHHIVEIEVESTHDFIEVMRQHGEKIRQVDPQLEHILISGMFSTFFEIVIHSMPKEQATEYVRELHTFQVAGWKKIMGLS